MIGSVVARDYFTSEVIWEADVSAIVEYAGMGSMTPGPAYSDALNLFLIRALALAPDEAARAAVAELTRGLASVPGALVAFEAAAEPPAEGPESPPPPPVVPDAPPAE